MGTAIPPCGQLLPQINAIRPRFDYRADNFNHIG